MEGPHTSFDSSLNDDDGIIQFTLHTDSGSKKRAHTDEMLFTSGDEEDNTKETVGDPWPYLNQFFVLKKAVKNKRGRTTMLYTCLNCSSGDKTSTISTDTTSRSNLNRHIKKYHSNKVEEFELLLTANTKKVGRRSKTAHSIINDDSQTSILSFTQSHQNSWISQATVDNMIVDWVTNSCQAFHAVEDPSFIRMISTFTHGKEVISRARLMVKINNNFKDMKEIPYIRNRRHLVRWSLCIPHILTPKLGRRNFAIACQRMKGKHDHQSIKKQLMNIFREFGIQWKLVGVVTDNARNFNKAFQQPSQDQDPLDQALLSEESNDETQAILLGDILNNAVDDDMNLPMHFSLNLVATVDIKNALKPFNGVYAKDHYHVFGILQKLWNKSNQSTTFSDKVRDKFSRLFITPTATRWNSVFDSVKRAKELREENRTAFNSLLAGANLPVLTDRDIIFIEEWLRVMQHLAAALDVLQGDKGIFLGHLLPTIAYLKLYLDEERDNVKKCKPLVDALLTGIEKRFGCYFEMREMLVASACLPQFKVTFLNEEIQQRAKRFLLEETSSFDDQLSSQLSQDVEQECNFFSKRRKKVDTAKQEVERYLADDSEGLDMILAYRRVKKVFHKYNVVLPSSSSSERLFSKAKRILRRTRQRLGDENFEKQLLLMSNKEANEK
ncbi:Uncharacterized protein FKW44_020724 [Caligus rogercresseyi]|uniref:Zinc finger BED domain-containing protein 4 n=1 Tax=Caligus rogercresseyi TaxID=217165 RepID=A0A7T8JUM8_CALRO|nr:Uncharacterized protein FKW44_020724 [Caligus rogercresseyi]